MSCVLYYSNYCGFSKNILTKLSRSNIKSDIHFLCVDKRVISDNKTYIVFDTRSGPWTWKIIPGSGK